jgi:soluble lytic murein transglycosylase-like protein
MSLAAAQARISQIQSLFPSPLTLAAAQAPSRAAGTATPGAPSGTAFSSALASAGQTLTLPASAALAPSAPSAPTSSRGGVTGDAVVAAGKKYLGVPYLWGGTDPAKGLDCSGFIQRTYRDLGIELPRVSRDQAKAGRPVASMAEARPGDLIAFGRPVDHIGIYVGDGKMIVAPRKGDVVKIQDVYRTPTAIRRILPDAAAASPAVTASAVSSITPTGRGEAAYAPLFAAAGARHGVSPALLTAVARAESGFDPSARSSAGAQGLMQFMPATARSLGIDPWNPEQAVDGAARLLKENLQRFGSTELALAAYNAGPGAVAKYGGVPPYSETQNYVRKIMTELRSEAA